MGLVGGLLLALLVIVAVSLIAGARFPGSAKPKLYDEPSVQNEIRKKEKLRERQQAGKGVQRKGGNPRLPPGQYAAQSWIILDLGLKISDDKYARPGTPDYGITVRGIKGGDRRLNIVDLEALGLEEFTVDWHCVTGWTKLDLGPFYGVRMSRLLEVLQPCDDWECLYQTSADGYTAPIARADLTAPSVFFAIYFGDRETVIPFEHGGPRIVCPELFGWKSAKYMTEMEFLPYQRKGFWETLGCNDRGRVALDERWAPQAHGIWTVLKGITSGYRVFGYSTWVRVMQAGGRLLGAIVQWIQPPQRRS